jgi:hypothetical protein
MFRRSFVPFCLTLALALGASVASAQGQSGQHPPANGNGGVTAQGCGGTQGGSTGCKGPASPRLVTLADIRTVLDLLGAILP